MDKSFLKQTGRQNKEHLAEQEVAAPILLDDPELELENVINDDEPAIANEEGVGDSDRYPKSNRLLTAIILSVMGAGAYVLDLVISSFNIKLAIPANYVYEFYYITLTVPAQTFPKVWGWLTTLGLSGNADVDKGIAVIGMLLYSSVVLWLYSVWVELVGIVMARLGNYDRPDILGAFKAYFLPALITTLYFFIIYIALLYGDTSTFG